MKRNIFLNFFLKDLVKKKTIITILFAFMVMAAFLVASAAHMVAELSDALHHFLQQANPPHFAQLHDGPILPQTITDWSAKNSLVSKFQIVEMLKVDGEKIKIGHDATEQDSIMTIDLVKQNQKFDFLLDLNNHVLQVNPGEIAIPIYFQQQNNLHLGDKVYIDSSTQPKILTIVAFLRDSQMNPAIIHSKRLVIHADDFQQLKQTAMPTNYLIEFQLTDRNKLSEFRNQYLMSDLPKQGPDIDYYLYKTLNSITDGMVIGILFLVSILLTLIALLCVRFAIIFTIEEDYKQISIMKALGIPNISIKKMYLTKYVFLTLISCFIGYLLSFLSKNLLTDNIHLYLGSAPSSSLQYILPGAAVATLVGIVLASCFLVLRHLDKVPVIEALSGKITIKKSRLFSIRSNKLNLNLFLGIYDVLIDPRKFLLPFLVFTVCMFVMILPLNFLNTLKSPSFITYLGIEKSDMRIDIQHSPSSAEQFQKVKELVSQDPDINDYASSVTYRYKMEGPDHRTQVINLETGAGAKFSLNYLKGYPPKRENEVALSYLNAKELHKKVGDQIKILADKEDLYFKVSGIYQDITNGGKTAKGLQPPDTNGVPLHYLMNVNFGPTVLINKKIQSYRNFLPGSRVTDLQDYLSQTMGELIKQLQQISWISFFIAMVISMLIASMFLVMLIYKQYRTIAIMKALGFSEQDLRIQFLIKILFVLCLGILFSLITVNTVGQWLVSIVWSFMGASDLRFIVDKLTIYLILPLIFMTIVSLATLISTAKIKNIKVANTVE
ncbi:MAG: FtsX-like permease family protein [Tatlockia sp.]|nr:FtsX-like permease family protein [Tatlockia sp.]